jgi:hypothetical protein
MTNILDDPSHKRAEEARAIVAKLQDLEANRAMEEIAASSLVDHHACCAIED